jgi:hypothetical protein
MKMLNDFKFFQPFNTLIFKLERAEPKGNIYNLFLYIKWPIVSAIKFDDEIGPQLKRDIKKNI